MTKKERDLIALFIRRIEEALQEFQDETREDLNQLRQVAGLEVKE